MCSQSLSICTIRGRKKGPTDYLIGGWYVILWSRDYSDGLPRFESLVSNVNFSNS